MNEAGTMQGAHKLRLPRAMLISAVAILSFNLAYSVPVLSCLIVVYLWCLCELGRVGSGRQAFYLGLATAIGCYAPQAGFLWTIFGPAAIVLWLILSIWVVLFLILNRLCRSHFNRVIAAILIPVIWTGLEYFRSELYYLRFSWFNAGYVFSGQLRFVPIHFLGVYGIGFVLMAFVSLASLLTPRRLRFSLLSCLLIATALITNLPGHGSPAAAPSKPGLKIAGIQMEFPSELEVTRNLDKLVKQYPEADLLVLSEYTFASPVPEGIYKWCEHNKRYLIIGAKDPVSGDDFYDTAFVIGADGKCIFRQAKCVPIQFFKDGFPAREQKLWDSPWGRIGMCICYDLSYARVTDELVRLGAQALIVPTMDLIDWGRNQHELHARVGPIRAAEYGLPIFRLASSGISQFVGADGAVEAIAPMPGPEATLFATVPLDKTGSLPMDRHLAPACTGVTGLVSLWLLLCIFRKKGTLPQNTRP